MPTNGLSFDTIPDSVTQRALALNYSIEEKARRTQMILNKDFYYGKQEQQLILVNEDVDPATLNITKPIVKKRASLLYKKKLVREMEGPAQSIAFIEQVYKDNLIDQYMLHIDLLAELTGSVLIHPTTTEDREKYPSGIKLMTFDSSQLSAVSEDDDPLEAAAISLVKEVTRLAARSTPQNPQVERILRQQVWTAEAVVTYNGRLDKGSVQNQLLRSETNTLSFLPFLNIRGEMVHDQYLGHAQTTSLRKLNEVVNQLLTHLNHIIKMQGFTPIALAGYQSGEAVTIHPGRAFSIPAGANAFVLSTDPKIQEMLQVLMHLEDKAFENSSVPKVSIVGGEGSSGRELMVRFFPLMQVFEDKAVRYQKNELDLANLILKVAQLPLLTGLFINYPEENLLPLSSDEDTLEKDIEFHIKTPIDELMRRDPDLDEVSAEAEIMANRDFNEELLRRGKSAVMQKQEEAPEEEEEEVSVDEEETEEEAPKEKEDE